MQLSINVTFVIVTDSPPPPTPPSLVIYDVTAGIQLKFTAAMGPNICLPWAPKWLLAPLDITIKKERKCTIQQL